MEKVRAAGARRAHRRGRLRQRSGRAAEASATHPAAAWADDRPGSLRAAGPAGAAARRPGPRGPGEVGPQWGAASGPAGGVAGAWARALGRPAGFSSSSSSGCRGREAATTSPIPPGGRPSTAAQAGASAGGGGRGWRIMDGGWHSPSAGRPLRPADGGNRVRPAGPTIRGWTACRRRTGKGGPV